MHSPNLTAEADGALNEEMVGDAPAPVCDKVVIATKKADQWKLNPDDPTHIAEVLARIPVQGERYPAQLASLVGR